MDILVWWEDVCEDALTAKGLNTQLRVIGGGARNATDKVNHIFEFGSKEYPLTNLADLPGQLTGWKVQHYWLLCRGFWYFLPVLRKLSEPSQA